MCEVVRLKAELTHSQEMVLNLFGSCFLSVGFRVEGVVQIRGLLVIRIVLVEMVRIQQILLDQFPEFLRNIDDLDNQLQKLLRFFVQKAKLHDSSHVGVMHLDNVIEVLCLRNAGGGSRFLLHASLLDLLQRLHELVRFHKCCPCHEIVI